MWAAILLFQPSHCKDESFGLTELGLLQRRALQGFIWFPPFATGCIAFAYRYTLMLVERLNLRHRNFQTSGRAKVEYFYFNGLDGMNTFKPSCLSQCAKRHIDFQIDPEVHHLPARRWIYPVNGKRPAAAGIQARCSKSSLSSGWSPGHRILLWVVGVSIGVKLRPVISPLYRNWVLWSKVNPPLSSRAIFISESLTLAQSRSLLHLHLQYKYQRLIFPFVAGFENCIIGTNILIDFWSITIMAIIIARLLWIIM